MHVNKLSERAFKLIHGLAGMDNGRTIGRLLVEVVEALNLETKSGLCEVRLGNQVQYTPALSPPYKWNTSMQFLLRDTSSDVLTIGLVSKNEFRPDGTSSRNLPAFERLKPESHA